MQAGAGLPYAAVQDLLGDVVDVVLHLERRAGRRRVTEALRVEGFDPAAGRWRCRPLSEAAGWAE